ncbi:MAG: hypothetical protein QOH28_59 [Actinomycetota bacterium]|nr:hypothetical protein [Actinomycetota bacterium]
MFASLASSRNLLDDVARTFDASSLSAEAVLRAVDELGAIRRVVDGMLAKAAKRVDETNAHGGVGAHNAAALVARTLGVGTGEVRAAIQTASRLERLPATDAAVRAGKLSARAAQLIAETAIVNPAAEESLLESAEGGLIPLRDACVAARADVEDPAARAIRQRSLRQWHSWTDRDGMVAGRYRFTPESGARIKAVIDAQSQRLFRGRKSGAHDPLAAYAADAVERLVLGDASEVPADPSTGVDAVVHVVIDHGALMRGGTAAGEVCDIPGVGPVDVAWVKELLGAAFVTAVVKKGKDILTVAHVGRHVPAEVMTALVVSGRECDVDGCHQRGYLERDHVQEHSRGGPTSFANLCWLCYAHHRLKSGGWQLGPPEPATRKRKLRPPPARAA